MSNTSNTPWEEQTIDNSSLMNWFIHKVGLEPGTTIITRHH